VALHAALEDHELLGGTWVVTSYVDDIVAAWPSPDAPGYFQMPRGTSGVYRRTTKCANAPQTQAC
jgi:hypothetical protein